jgi:preprotein translocase subunit SecY
VVIASLTAGSAFLMWIGERITQNGVGNGISIVLTINIVSRMPSDFINLFRTYIIGQPVVNAIIAALAIAAIAIGTTVLVIFLQTAERKIPVTYAKKVQGRKMVGGQTSHIPLKVNTAGVIPVIFSNSLMSFPIVVAGFFGVSPAREYFWPKVLKVLSQNSWFVTKSWGDFKYTIGVLLYIVLNIFFAYF